MRVEFSRFVESDLEEIADWIAEDNPGRAVSFIQEFREAFRRIGQSPLLYQLSPDIGEEARLAVVGRYVILFRVDDEAVMAERVLFGGRDLPLLFRIEKESR
jgi:plasmid stabilization system protein ParE